MQYWETFRFVLDKKSTLSVFMFTILYIALTSYVLNHNLFLNTLFGNNPLSYKLSILILLPLGLYSALSRLDFYLLIITSILMGVNLILLFSTIKNLRKSSEVGILVGGGSILSIAAIGCTSCGLSILSILGFSAALTILPLDGLTVHFISLGLLMFSAFYMLKKLKAVCKIPSKR